MDYQTAQAIIDLQAQTIDALNKKIDEMDGWD